MAAKIPGFGKIDNIRRSMKFAKQAIDAAHDSARAGRDIQRAVVATEAGKIAQELRQAAPRVADPKPNSEQRQRLSEAEMLNWRGPLPPGMTGAE